MRPRWSVLELGGAERAWADAAQTFLSHVVGPSFEQTCRSWALATPHVFPELPAEVGSGVITDPATKARIQVDVAVLAAAQPGRPRRVLSLGEVNSGKQLGMRHLRRLVRAGELLQAHGYDTTAMVRGCYSASGFEPDLIAAAATDDSILLVDAERLYL